MMKKNTNRMLILFLLLLPLPFLFVSNTSAIPLEDTSLQDVIDAGVIVVGIEPYYPPFEQRNLETDEIEGFDPDIMQYIADDIGVSIEWVDVSWAVIFTSLEAGMFDCIISAVTITTEREEHMDFSRWYYRSALAVMVSDDNPKGIEALDDINSTDVKVGVQAGTYGEWYIDDEGIVAEKVAFATIGLAIEALKFGTIDVVLGDYGVLKDIKETDSELFYIIDVFNIEEFGIPVQTGSDSLRLRINSILDNLLGEDIEHPQPNTYYTTSYEEWLGGTPYLEYEVDTIPLEDSSLQDVIDAGKIVVGIEAGYPPFEQRDPETDEIVGFDPDIMQYIADDIGVSIEWVDVSWSVIFTSLESGMFDCIISAVTITAEREEHMDFSRWYYKSALAVMVNDDNPMGIENLEDINSTDVKVGFQAGTASNWYIDDEGIVAEQFAYATMTLAVEALKQGVIDVVLGDYSILRDIKETDSELLYIIDTFGIEELGIPVQTGFDSLRLRINSILDDLLGDDINNPEPNAYYSASYEEWFGVKPYFDTSTTTFYTIHASCGNNGDIDPEGEIEVAEGNDKRFTFTPDDGYMVDKIIVDGTNVGDQSSFTFNNVESDHTIEVEFVEITEGSPFEIAGYSIIPFMIFSFAVVSIITVKIHQRRLN